MNKNIAKEISEYIFSSVYKYKGNKTVAICIHNTKFGEDVHKRQVGYWKVYGYSIENNSALKSLTITIIFTDENKFWVKKNIGKLVQKHNYKNFILVDKDNFAYLVDCTTSDVKNFDENYLGQFSVDNLESLCPNTVFVRKQPLNWLSAMAEDRSIEFSEDDSTDIFNEKLQQKYNQLAKSLMRRIIRQIKNKITGGEP